MGFAIAVGALGTGCYTDPVNMAPTVRIDAPPQPIFFGQPFTYTATASDPDGPTPTLAWTATTDGPCKPEATANAASWPTKWGGPTGMVDGSVTKAPFCVWVKATDREGAATVDARSEMPQDHAPSAALVVVQPADGPSFPLGAMFILSATSSTDADEGDKLAFAWKFKATPSKTAALTPCANPNVASAGSPDGSVQCFTADAPGDYEVHLDVTDHAGTGLPGEVDSVDKTLHVAPGPVPIAVLDLVTPTHTTPYGLGEMFHVSSARSKGDGTTPPVPDWSDFHAPGGSVAALNPCGDDPSEQCFVPDVPGPYSVGLSVHAGSGTSAPVSATYAVVEDQPPCLESTTPDFATPVTTATEFVVGSISDDRDPFPPTKLMQWFVSENGGAFMPADRNFPSFSFDKAAFSFGDVVRVRLEIRDRDDRRANDEFLACGAADVCTATSLLHPAACFQRVTWTVNILP